MAYDDLLFDFDLYVVNGLADAEPTFTTFSEELVRAFSLELKPDVVHHGEDTILENTENYLFNGMNRPSVFLMKFFEIQCIKKGYAANFYSFMQYVWHDFGVYHVDWAERSDRNVSDDFDFVTKFTANMKKGLAEAMHYFRNYPWECHVCPKRSSQNLNDSCFLNNTLRHDYGRSYGMHQRQRRMKRRQHCHHFKFHSGIHLCVCGSTFKGHNAFIAHILPTTQSVANSPELYLDIRNMCPVALLYIMLLSSRDYRFFDDVRQLPEYMCACGRIISGFFSWLHHTTICVDNLIWLRVGCPFCPKYYKPLEQIAIAKSCVELYQFPLNYPPDRDMRHFYTFFIRGITPSAIFNHLDMYEGLARANVQFVPLLTGDFEENVSTILQTHVDFETTLRDYWELLDHRYQSWPFICDTCHVRKNWEGEHEVSNSINCLDDPHMHVCRCGEIMTNHWDYWFHTFIACRFYTSTHLMLFILLSNTDRLECVCAQHLIVTDLNFIMAHFMNCPQLIQYMIEQCPFCTDEFKYRERNELSVFVELWDHINVFSDELTFDSIRRLRLIVNESFGIPSMMATPLIGNPLDFLNSSPIQFPGWVELAISCIRFNLHNYQLTVRGVDTFAVDSVALNLFFYSSELPGKDDREMNIPIRYRHSAQFYGIWYNVRSDLLSLAENEGGAEFHPQHMIQEPPPPNHLMIPIVDDVE